MTAQPRKPLVIVVRDGWGVREEASGNAVASAKTPRHDELWARFPTALINASEHYVGLPDGQMGNSEVGHLNMGAGRVVYQDFARIEASVRDGSFAENEVLRQAMDRAQERDRALHLMGLCSDGGVHSHLRHLEALLRGAQQAGVERVFVHAILDGRDTDPRGGAQYLRTLLDWTASCGAKLASVAGRYYTMDRDQRWDRVRAGYDVMVHGRGPTTEDPVAALERFYAEGGGVGDGDEFFPPTVVTEGDRPVGPMQRGDQVIAFNFRADRMRQICRALCDANFNAFDRGHTHQGFELATMTQYQDDLPVRGVAFGPQSVRNHLSEFLASKACSQFKCAETEKYAHVTFFWNGGVEQACPGEERQLIPSPKVATYDLQPEMHAAQVADAMVARIRARDDGLLVVNFANTDMVGHTGKFDAAVHAVEAVDAAVGRVVEAILVKGGAAIVTADHGNCEQMVDPNTGGPHTAHTTLPVHAVLCDAELEGRAVRSDGALADIAPTALQLMGLEPPAEMTGRSLLVPE